MLRGFYQAFPASSSVFLMSVSIRKPETPEPAKNCQFRQARRFLRATRPVCHCKSEAQAVALKQALEARMKEVGLEFHPEKTRCIEFVSSLHLLCYTKYV